MFSSELVHHRGARCRRTSRAATPGSGRRRRSSATDPWISRPLRLGSPDGPPRCARVPARHRRGRTGHHGGRRAGWQPARRRPAVLPHRHVPRVLDRRPAGCEGHPRSRAPRRRRLQSLPCHHRPPPRHAGSLRRRRGARRPGHRRDAVSRRRARRLHRRVEESPRADRLVARGRLQRSLRRAVVQPFAGGAGGASRAREGARAEPSHLRERRLVSRLPHRRIRRRGRRDGLPELSARRRQQPRRLRAPGERRQLRLGGRSARRLRPILPAESAGLPLDRLALPHAARGSKPALRAASRGREGRPLVHDVGGREPSSAGRGARAVGRHPAPGRGAEEPDPVPAARRAHAARHGRSAGARGAVGAPEPGRGRRARHAPHRRRRRRARPAGQRGRRGASDVSGTARDGAGGRGRAARRHGRPRGRARARPRPRPTRRHAAGRGAGVRHPGWRTARR
jgi:hypothetical protein